MWSAGENFFVWKLFGSLLTALIGAVIIQRLSRQDSSINIALLESTYYFLGTTGVHRPLKISTIFLLYAFLKKIFALPWLHAGRF